MTTDDLIAIRAKIAMTLDALQRALDQLEADTLDGGEKEYVVRQVSYAFGKMHELQGEVISRALDTALHPLRPGR